MLGLVYLLNSITACKRHLLHYMNGVIYVDGAMYPKVLKYHTDLVKLTNKLYIDFEINER